MRLLLTLLVLVVLSCKTVDYQRDMNFRFEMVESDVNEFSDAKFGDPNFVQRAKDIWFSDMTYEESMDRCYLNFVEARNGARRTWDTLKKKAMFEKAMSKLFECQYDLPEEFCGILLNKQKQSYYISRDLRRYLEYELDKIVNTAKEIFGLDQDLKIDIIIDDELDIGRHFGEKERSIYISNELIRAVYLYEFTKLRNEYYRIQILRHKSLEKLNSTDDIGNNWAEKLYRRVLRQFEFGIYHEMAHKLIRLKNMNVSQLEKQCDCLAIHTFKSLNKNIAFGLFEKLIHEDQNYCDFWEVKNGNQQERIRRTIESADSLKLYEQNCGNTIKNFLNSTTE